MSKALNRYRMAEDVKTHAHRCRLNPRSVDPQLRIYHLLQIVRLVRALWPNSSDSFVDGAGRPS